MRGEERQSRRGDALDAAGLTQARRADREELLLDFVGEPREAAIVEVGRQDRRIVAAIARDVLGLAIKINRVFRVGFEPGNKMSGNIGQVVARCAQDERSGTGIAPRARRPSGGPRRD